MDELKKKKMSKCVCLVCDSEVIVNFNPQNENEKSDKNIHLKWTVFCQYFNLDLENWSKIMEMDNLPFCKKCSPFVDQMVNLDEKLQSILQNIQKIAANLSNVLISSANSINNKNSSSKINRSMQNEDTYEEEIRNCRRTIAQNYDPKIPLSRYNSKFKSKARLSDKSKQNVKSSATTLIAHSTQDFQPLESPSKLFIYDGIWKFTQIETEFKCSTCDVIKPSILSMKRHIRNFHSTFSTDSHQINNQLGIFSNTKILEPNQIHHRQQENSAAAIPSSFSTQLMIKPRTLRSSNSDGFLVHQNNYNNDSSSSSGGFDDNSLSLVNNKDPLLFPNNVKMEMDEEMDKSCDSFSAPTYHISLPLAISSQSFYDESNDVENESEMDEYQEEEEEDEKQFSANKDKPYKCDQPNCNKAYKKLYTLKCHKKWHMGIVRKFTCKICSSQYTRKSKLKEHEWKKHQLKTPTESTARNKTCSICNITFRRPGLYEKHVRRHKDVKDSVANESK